MPAALGITLAAAAVVLLALAGAFSGAPGSGGAALPGAVGAAPGSASETLGPRVEGASARLPEAPGAVAGTERDPSPEGAAASAATHTVTVRLVDAGGAPIPSASARLELPAGALEASVDAEGRARLALPPQSDAADALRVELRAPGYAALRLERRRQAGDLTAFGDQVLLAGGDVAGRVTDARGFGLAGATVVAAERASTLSADDRELQRHRGPGLHDMRLFDWEDAPPFAVSAEDGSFEFAGLPVGYWRLWAVLDDRPWGLSEAFDLSAGARVAGVRIELDAPTPRRYLVGRVEDPAGQPVVGASIDVRALLPPKEGDAPGDLRSWRSRVTSGLDGAFRVAALADVPHTLSSEPAVWEWDVARLEDVRPGTPGLVLAYEEADWLWARVTDGEGRALTVGRVEGRDLERHRRLPRVVSDLWDDGRARLHAPAEPFELEASAPGYATRVVGPFEPGAHPDPIEIVLEAGGGLRGTVLRAGRPVGDAHVALYSSAPEGSVYGSVDWAGLGEGPRLRARDYTRWEARTDAEGQFVIEPPSQRERGSAQWMLVARAPSGASAVQAPLDLESEAPLVVELGAAASLAGRLLLEEGEDGRGWHVFAIDASLTRHWVAAEQDGSYRIDELAPGGWIVRAFEPGREYVRSIRRQDGSPSTPDVVLAPGEAGRLDLVVERKTGELVGWLGLGGHDADVWRVELHTQDPQKRLAAVALDDQGRFRLPVPPDVPVLLAFNASDARYEHFSILDRFTAHEGVNTWSLELELGELAGRWEPPAGSSDTQHVIAYRAEPRPNLTVSGFFWVREPGPAGPWLLPAGPGTLIPRGDGFRSRVLATDREPVEITIPAGERLEVELP